MKKSNISLVLRVICAVCGFINGILFMIKKEKVSFVINFGLGALWTLMIWNDIDNERE